MNIVTEEREFINHTRVGEGAAKGREKLADADKSQRPADNPDDAVAKDSESQSTKLGSWPYGVEKGRLVHFKKSKDEVTSTPIADLEARIVGEIIGEDSTKSFVIEGKGIRGSKFTVEIPAAQFGDRTTLLSIIEAESSRDGVRAGMKQYLGPAIKAMTQSTWVERRYTRV